MSLKKNPEVIALIDAAVAKANGSALKAEGKRVAGIIKDQTAAVVTELTEAGDKAGAKAVKNFAKQLQGALKGGEESAE